MNKYYIQNDIHRFFLGKLDSFDAVKMKFSILIPFDILTIIIKNDSYVSTSEYDIISIGNVFEKDGMLELKINTPENNISIKAVVLESGRYKDFISFKDTDISLPKSIMQRITTITFY